MENKKVYFEVANPEFADSKYDGAQSCTIVIDETKLDLVFDVTNGRTLLTGDYHPITEELYGLLGGYHLLHIGEYSLLVKPLSSTQVEVVSISDVGLLLQSLPTASKGDMKGTLKAIKSYLPVTLVPSIHYFEEAATLQLRTLLEGLKFGDFLKIEINNGDIFAVSFSENIVLADTYIDDINIELKRFVARLKVLGLDIVCHEFLSNYVKSYDAFRIKIDSPTYNILQLVNIIDKALPEYFIGSNDSDIIYEKETDTFVIVLDDLPF